MDSIYRSAGPTVAGLLALNLLLAGCDSSPTAPAGEADDQEYPVTEETLASPAEVEVYVPVLDYAREIVVPALEDRQAASAIDAQLDTLQTALNRRDGQTAARAVDRAYELLGSYGDVESRIVDGANLGVIQLALVKAAALLGWDPQFAQLPQINL